MDDNMTRVTFYKPEKVEDKNLEFAVIAARYHDKWVYCRHKERSTWEIPGGHREHGETIIETAHRELAEETGAVDAEIKVVAAYGVEKSGQQSYGMLFFANIHNLGDFPEDSEIGKIQLFDTLPENLTYPEIQPHLYHSIQGWLNIQSNAGEMWESTGGSALAGDDSLSAALREVKEETGLIADPNNGKCVISFRREECFVDVWLFKQDFDLNDVILQEGETCDKMYASADKIKELNNSGMFVPYSYLQQLLDMAK